ncbi:phosphoribosyl-AMP cyclohydrolase [Salinisphaera sp.]|uniref:phosphoribosyl-AMP cyclohydrolase n=1 Tax=Salinisphaera sp. TaxID=1914330 RepID=UPI000C50D256|nr:phosphoribosyl-AMP cyclohydrolase [Salinisphaera sp.]MBS62334.1 phosphoribosyl-AMP cyclohydrolase [Salinisphaera sp.]
MSQDNTNQDTEGDRSADWLDQVAWNEQGLVPAITQAYDTQRVLTLAWMNRESLAATLDSGFATYWSRSRAKLWRKGESSGNLQRIREVRLDCDNDAVLLIVEQIGGVACHTGRESCFFQVYDNGRWVTRDPVLVDPSEMYGLHE